MDAESEVVSSQSRNRCAVRWTAFALLLAAPPAQADVLIGFPLMWLYSFYSLLFLVPVIVIEAVVFRFGLKTPYWRALGASFLANLASTLVGLLVSIIVTLVLIAAVPSSTEADLFTLALLYPFYCLSIYIERPVVLRVLGSGKEAKVRAAVFAANRASYLMIAVFIVARIVKSRIVHGYFM